MVGSLILVGVGSAMAGGIDPSGQKPAGNPAAGSTPDSEPSEPVAAPAAPTAAATPTTKPQPKPEPKTFLVANVVDGDTIELRNGDTVRLVGIDSPERGECGHERSSDNLARLVLGKEVRLVISDEDVDRYGRLLRYVDLGSVDAGLAQLKDGHAIARYDSRDGYGFHPREPIYLKADRGAKQFSCPKPKPAPVPLVGGGGAENCMVGYSPCLPIVGDLDCGELSGPFRVTGSDPYRLDADGDGIGCDS